MRQDIDSDVEVVGRRCPTLPHALLRPLADHEQPPLQRLVLQPLAADKDLPHDRLGRAGDLAQAAVVGGHVAPAQHLEPSRSTASRPDLFARPAAAVSVAAGTPWPRRSASGGQGKAQPVGLGGEELVGNLHQDARPVAGRFVGPGRPAVHQVHQHLLAVFDDLVLAPAGNIDDRADAAGIVLPPRIVQTLGLGRGGFHVLAALPGFVHLLADILARVSADKDLPSPHYHRIISLANVNGTIELALLTSNGWPHGSKG